MKDAHLIAVVVIIKFAINAIPICSLFKITFVLNLITVMKVKIIKEKQIYFSIIFFYFSCNY